MHRTALLSAALLAATLGALPAADPPARDAFFDGQSLDTFDGLKQYWKVVDGAIVGSTEPGGLTFNTFLCSKRKYRDFELKFQVRLKDGRGNSGVQVRSEVFDRKHLAVKGPQCDIGEGYWGSLYGEHFGGMMKAAPASVQKKVKKDDFNDYDIKCVGKHVTITLNGAKTVDDDFPTIAHEGIVAFQLHAGGPMEVRFKDLRLEVLPPDARVGR